jgi:predicted ATPase
LWSLGYPEAALADADQALNEAREIGHAATLMFALFHVSLTQMHCGNHARANMLIEELVVLADEKRASFWKAGGILLRGWLFALTGNPLDAIQMIRSGMAAWRSTGATVWMPLFLSHLATNYFEIDKFDDSWRCIDEAIAAVDETKEAWCEAEVHRVAGEIALNSLEPDAAKAQAYFESALLVARAQQAKSWELRAAMSMARLWRSQGRRDEARKLLAPVYGWFTEGFDTLDLKQARVLLTELAS